MTSSLALLTDLYQLTMAYGYWQSDMHEDEAVFHLMFRKHPFQGNYALNCGLATIIDYLKSWKFSTDDISYLAELTTSRGEPLFSTPFLDYLANFNFACDIDAIPEGTVVFAFEPLIRVQGPLLQCQLLESILLNLLNFQTLVATKSARICLAAENDPVIEFGMRRAQGPDGALSASRAAYIGGCVATSNVLAGKKYGIPVRGTHAHSWVAAFDSEKEAFATYAQLMPENCVLLVDTYSTVKGVKNAIEVGKVLRQQGQDLFGVRLDSGDMAKLSIDARNLLDKAGFEQTHILASNNLDEYVIQDLKQRGAKITMWGVGTNLVTAYDQPALDGVYKLSALQNEDNSWQPKLKLSEQEVKISNPGRHQVRRFFCNDRYVADVIYDIDLGLSDVPEMICFSGATQQVRLDDNDGFVDLLQPIFKRGKLVAAEESIHAIRQRAIHEVQQFTQKHGNAIYPVGLEKNLDELKQQLISEVKSKGHFRIRSFVRRDSRITDAQQEAFDVCWPRYGLLVDNGELNYAEVFKRTAPRILEIGFGSGQSLLAAAKKFPEQDFIGVETFKPGVGALFLGVQAQELTNIRVYYADAVEVLEQCIPNASLDRVQIFFPDPWPKRKHHKRRLIQPAFVNLLVSKLKPEGVLHLATDWEHYGMQMMEVLSNCKELVNLAGQNQFAERSPYRPLITKFEQRGTNAGREIWELEFNKISHI